MSIKRIETGPRLSRAVVYNGLVFLAGMTADDTSADVKGQTEQILAKIDRYLKEAGSDKSKLLTATIWVSDMAKFNQMNKAWDAWVAAGHTPPRATVQAALARPEWKVEIVVTAAV